MSVEAFSYQTDNPAIQAERLNIMQQHQQRVLRVSGALLAAVRLLTEFYSGQIANGEHVHGAIICWQPADMLGEDAPRPTVRLRTTVHTDDLGCIEPRLRNIPVVRKAPFTDKHLFLAWKLIENLRDAEDDKLISLTSDLAHIKNPANEAAENVPYLPPVQPYEAP